MDYNTWKRGERFQGIVCKRNPAHGSEKYVSNGACCGCIRELGAQRDEGLREAKAKRLATASANH